MTMIPAFGPWPEHPADADEEKRLASAQQSKTSPISIDRSRSAAVKPTSLICRYMYYYSRFHGFCKGVSPLLLAERQIFSLNFMQFLTDTK